MPRVQTKDENRTKPTQKDDKQAPKDQKKQAGKQTKKRHTRQQARQATGKRSKSRGQKITPQADKNQTPATAHSRQVHDERASLTEYGN